MKFPLIATLIVAHRAVAYTSPETFADVLEHSERDVLLQKSRNSLDSLMSRANEKIHVAGYAKDNREMEQPERGQSRFWISSPLVELTTISSI